MKIEIGLEYYSTGNPFIWKLNDTGNEVHVKNPFSFMILLLDYSWRYPGKHGYQHLYIADVQVSSVKCLCAQNPEHSRRGREMGSLICSGVLNTFIFKCPSWKKPFKTVWLLFVRSL